MGNKLDKQHKMTNKSNKKKAGKVAVGGKKVEELPEPNPLTKETEPTETEQVQMERVEELQDDSTASTAASVADEQGKEYEPATPFNSDVAQEEHDEFESDELKETTLTRVSSAAVLTKNFALKNVKNFAITTTVVSLAWFPAVCIGFWTGVGFLVVPASRPIISQSIANLETKMTRALQV
jgi:hypothetical protein